MAEFLSDNPDLYGTLQTDDLKKAQDARAALDEIQTERFYKTLKSYYSYRDGNPNIENMSPADLLEYFYKDRSWRNNNTISMGLDLASVANETNEKRIKEFSYIQQTYNALPSWWDDPNRSFGNWLIDNGGAMLADPINLVGVGVGGQVAKSTFSLGLKELLKGKMASELNKAAIEEMAKQATKASLGQAVKKGALYEGYIGATVTGLQDSILQNTAIESGIQNEFDFKQTALSTASGFGFGTVFGGAFAAGAFKLTNNSLKNTAIKNLYDIQEYGQSNLTGRQLYKELVTSKKESELFKNLPKTTKKEKIDITTDEFVSNDTFQNRWLNFKITPVTGEDKPPYLPINITTYQDGLYTRLIKQRAQELKSKVDSADKISFENMIDIAASRAIEMGGDPRTIKNELRKLAKNPKTRDLFAFRVIAGDLLAKDASELIDLSNKFSRIDLTPEEKIKIEKQIDDMLKGLDELIQINSDLGTAAARATAAGRITKEKTRLAELLSKPEDPNMAALKQKDKTKFIETISKLDDTEQMILALENVKKANKWDIAAEWVNNNLLASPDTHILNLVSGLVQTQWKPFVMLLRAANMVTKDKQRAVVIAREALQTYIYQYVYTWHALKAFGKTLVKGRATLDSAQMKFDSNIRQGQLARWLSATGRILSEPAAQIASEISNDAVGKIIGSTIQLPFAAAGLIETIPLRVLAAGDEFLKTMTFKARLASIINSEIMRQNPDYGIFLKGKLFTEDYTNKFRQIEKQFVNEKGVANAIGTTVNETLNSPLQYAREGSYTQSAYSTNPITGQEEGGITGWVLETTNKFKPLRVFGLHFINTPSNLLRWNFQHLPFLGRYQFQMRHMLAKGADGKYINPEAAAEANARIQAGWLLWSSAFALVSAGKFTGGGSKDWKETQQKQDLTGWQPYSYVTSDGRYIKMDRLDPIMTPIFIMADMWETVTSVYNKTNDLPYQLESKLMELSVGTVLTLTRNITSKFYTKNLFDTLIAATNGTDMLSRKPEQKLEASFSRGLFKILPLSGGLRYMNRITDNWERDLWSFSDRMSTYYNQERPMPRRDMFGNPIERKTGWLFGLDLLSSPFAVDKFKNTETAKFFRDRESIDYRPPSSIDPYLKGFDLRSITNSKGQTAYDRWLEIKSELKVNEKYGLVTKSDKGISLKDYVENLIKNKTSELYKYPDGTVLSKDGQQSFILQKVHAVERVAYWEMVKEFPQITEYVKQLDYMTREAYKIAKEQRNIDINRQNSTINTLKNY